MAEPLTLSWTDPGLQQIAAELDAPARPLASLRGNRCSFPRKVVAGVDRNAAAVNPESLPVVLQLVYEPSLPAESVVVDTEPGAAEVSVEVLGESGVSRKWEEVDNILEMTAGCDTAPGVKVSVAAAEVQGSELASAGGVAVEEPEKVCAEEGEDS